MNGSLGSLDLRLKPQDGVEAYGDYNVSNFALVTSSVSGTLHSSLAVEPSLPSPQRRKPLGVFE